MVDKNIQDRPKVLIAVTQSIAARNLFFGRFLPLLERKYRPVLLCHPDGLAEMRERFPGYEIAPLRDGRRGPMRRIVLTLLLSLYRSLVYNPSVEIYTKTGFYVKDRPKRYAGLLLFIRRWVFGRFLSRYAWPRDLVRRFDRLVFSPRQYEKLFRTQDPALVFVTNIFDAREIELLREAKRNGVKTAAMTRSWDNFSKSGIRDEADRIQVWGEYMADEAVKFQRIGRERVDVIGVPQFDHYHEPRIPAREEFCRAHGLDPERKFIFYGSIGQYSTVDPYVVRVLAGAIKDGRLEGHQILVRPHLMYMADMKRFEPLADGRTVFLDRRYKNSSFPDHAELGTDGILSLAAAVKYSSVAVTGSSTLVLDIAALGKSAILYCFDEEKDTPFYRSTRRLYQALWFREILSFGANHLVESEDALIGKIIAHESDPHLLETERSRLLERFCYKVDGKAGERLYECLDRMISDKKLKY